MTLDRNAWTTLLDELHDATEELSQHFDGSDQATILSAAGRHAIERALDRYQVASDGVTRHVDQILARTAPRPRR